MSTSSYVIGFKPPDKKWRKMKAARDACIDADIPIPEEVEYIFTETEISVFYKNLENIKTDLIQVKSEIEFLILKKHKNDKSIHLVTKS